ncbi:hypothetical protein BRW65_06970 [Mycobacterium paraffinicum]|uniref:Uncharacterized protein n=2 Tax=Mycobacterium paraffinicum TaxID=53378 RepID=A0A1Q4HZ76_9MYCO|nr:hypothetical protein BRW65_06970 [Mycobacterium paraffinicum]
MPPIARLSAAVSCRPPEHLRSSALRAGLTAAALVAIATLALLLVERIRPAAPAGVPAWRWRPATFLLWTIGDTTEPGFAHSAFGGLLMVLGGLVAHLGLRAGRRWMGFPVSSGTGLYLWTVGSAGLGLVLSNLVWGWTIAVSGEWQPTFVPFASVPAAVVLIYGGRPSVALTGAVLGAGLTTPVALAAVNLGCRPLGLPTVIGATTGMWISALIGFALCRRLPWLPQSEPLVPGCDTGCAHCLTCRAPLGSRWLARRMLADFTEAQFIGNEWAGAGLLVGTVTSYLVDPATASGAGNLLPRLLIAQTLSAGMAVAAWRRQWAKHGWYPTFVPVVSVAPATVLAFGGTAQAVVAGAVLGALTAPPVAAAIARRLPTDFHPFIGNVVSMCVLTAVTVTGLSILPGFSPAAANN